MMRKLLKTSAAPAPPVFRQPIANCDRLFIRHLIDSSSQRLFRDEGFEKLLISLGAGSGATSLDEIFDGAQAQGPEFGGKNFPSASRILYFEGFPCFEEFPVEVGGQLLGICFWDEGR
jgi:hypothetical protein